MLLISGTALVFKVNEEDVAEEEATPTEPEFRSPPSEPMSSIPTTDIEEDAPAPEVEEPLDFGSIFAILLPLIIVLGLAFILKRRNDLN